MKIKEASKDIAIALGAGLIGVAGAIFLYGKNGTKNRKQIRSWALKAKGELLERLESLGEVSENAYNRAVDEVMKRYEDMKGVDRAELAALAKELKGHWRSIKKEATAGAKKAKKTVGKVVKKAVKAKK